MPRPQPDEVFNQPPPLEDYNLFAHDAPLREALRREGGAWAEEKVREFGALVGRAETLHFGEPSSACPAHARPLRPSRGRGRVSPGLARVDAHRRRARTPLAALDEPARGRARRPRRAQYAATSNRRGRELPSHHDLRALLVRHAPQQVADAFCASRLAGDAGFVFGMLPANTDFAAIIERLLPEI
jgi:hypothetical protein